MRVFIDETELGYSLTSITDSSNELLRHIEESTGVQCCIPFFLCGVNALGNPEM